ncbi:hypothetical protein [Nocardiopsis algeriensis]|uniref:Uncharacterized protein n=1 Tax=Nocardiopsis algeriensis TaxID=1478215 RepID=A0A841IJ40_9ACTN|nr:hypothetical protein [Nocardiopsis algeriensis]MBB6118120.1 hypothetical protein [Nocardiopsis algeriensis]
MSSSPLYLAIVVVWLIVLVPMLLRRDPVEPVHEEPRREAEEAPEQSAGEAESAPEEGSPEEHDEGEEDRGAPLPAREPRARVIARRRRRTSTLVLLTVGTVAAVALGLGPWWVIAPPVLLLSGHLILLREAAKADAERREAALRARRRAALKARREAEERRRDAEREAEVIALRERRSQVYDQYADARLRAAGD